MHRTCLSLEELPSSTTLTLGWRLTFALYGRFSHTSEWSRQEIRCWTHGGEGPPGHVTLVTRTALWVEKNTWKGVQNTSKNIHIQTLNSSIYNTLDHVLYIKLMCCFNSHKNYWWIGVKMIEVIWDDKHDNYYWSTDKLISIIAFSPGCSSLPSHLLPISQLGVHCTVQCWQ